MERRVTALPSALPPSSRVDVAFTSDDAAVPSPKQTFGSTDEGGRAPRNRSSRHINFSDDGKLFEGHFTVQSRNLKSIIQYLVDRNAEQDVIVQDLQKQVHLLRTRQLKASQRSGRNGMGLLAAAADSGAGGAGGDVDGRLRLVEQFLQLWGVRLSEVAELVEEHGDSVITPDAYTSYLLDLPAFRFTRREARAFMTSASQQPALNAAAAAASDTATRRRNNSNPSRRERGSASPPPDLERRKPEAEAPAAAATAAAASAESTVEKANAALAKAEALLAELRGMPARPTAAPPQLKGRSGAADRDKARSTSGSGGGGGSGGGASGGSAVDAEARADIEELGEYVMRRFQELESQSMMTAAAAARATAVASASALRSEKRGSTDRGAGGGAAQAKAAAAAARVAKPSPPKKGAANSPTSTQAAQLAAPPPPLPRAVPGEMVDLVAREDAAASLDLLEELESTVERRFKEVNSALASIAVRTAALAKVQVRSGSGSVEGERGQQGQQSPQRIPGSPKAPRGASTGSSGNKSRNATPGRRGDKGFDSPRQSLTAPVGDELADAEHTESRPSSNAGAALAAAGAAPAPVRASASSSAAAAAKGSRPGKGKGGAAAAFGDGVAAALVPAAGGPAVDQVAREETAALSDRVSDLEEELLERWQAMEERLRIIGRAALKQNATAAVAGPGGTAAAPVSRAPVVDRKAREDAALSLMRLQQLERELAQLKRALSGSPLNGSAARAGLLSADSYVSGGGDAAMAALAVSMEPSAPLRDTYGSKVADLEKEVEQRMAEVNQAIAQLRSTGNGMGMGMAALAQPGPAARATASTGSADPLTDPHTLAWAATLAPNTTPSSLDAASPATAQSHAIVPDQLMDRYGATSGTLPLSVLSMPMPATASLASAPSLASGQPSPVNALAGASAPGTGSHLTLRATDPDVYAVGSGVNAVAAERAATPAVDPSQRAAARLSVLALGHQSKTADMDFFGAFALAGGNSPGQRRTTISRLRAPDAPTFGSNLVQRAVVDLPEEAAAAATSSSEAAEAARGRAAAPGSSVVAAPPQPGSSFATVGHGAPRDGPSKAGLSSSESRTFTVSPPPGGPKANTARARVSQVQPEASSFASTTPPRPVRRETIGHAEPCVVVNCAWCDAEKATEPTAS